MPTQRPAPTPVLATVAQSTATEEPPKPTPKLVAVSPAAAPVAVTQFSLSLRKELHKQLGRLASDADMTMRAFVLNALKEKGLAVTEDDLKDLRRERR